MRYPRIGALIALVLLATACTQANPTVSQVPGADPGFPGAPGVPGPSGSPGTGGEATDAPVPPGSESPVAPGAFEGMVVTRTGGIAGVMQSLIITPDGAWNYADERSGAAEEGQLTPAQRQQLISLLSNPALAAEAAKPSAEGCADAFLYVLAVVQATYQYEQCGDPSQRPLTEQLVTFLTDATAL
jgi:hypothetical protein